MLSIRCCPHSELHSQQHYHDLRHDGELHTAEAQRWPPDPYHPGLGDVCPKTGAGIFDLLVINGVGVTGWGFCVRLLGGVTGQDYWWGYWVEYPHNTNQCRPEPDAISYLKTPLNHAIHTHTVSAKYRALTCLQS